MAIVIPGINASKMSRNEVYGLNSKLAKIFDDPSVQCFTHYPGNYVEGVRIL